MKPILVLRSVSCSGAFRFDLANRTALLDTPNDPVDLILRDVESIEFPEFLLNWRNSNTFIDATLNNRRDRYNDAATSTRGSFDQDDFTSLS